MGEMNAETQAVIDFLDSSGEADEFASVVTSILLNHKRDCPEAWRDAALQFLSGWFLNWVEFKDVLVKKQVLEKLLKAAMQRVDYNVVAQYYMEKTDANDNNSDR